MSKFDSLLKKVELFERLAEHGDRRAFLQSLSQATPSLYSDPVKPGTPGTPGGRPLSLSEKLQGGPVPQRYIELDQGEGEPAAKPAPTTTPVPPPAPSLTGKPAPTPGAPGTPGGRPLTLEEKLKGPPYPTK